MKNTILAVALAASTAAVGATEVSLSAVRDFGVNANGVQAEVRQPITPALGIKARFTHADSIYNRTGIAADYTIGKVGPVQFNVVGGTYYQRTLVEGVNGYGLHVGTNAVYELTPTLELIGSVERNFNQTRINHFNGNTVAIGARYKFQ